MRTRSPDIATAPEWRRVAVAVARNTGKRFGVRHGNADARLTVSVGTPSDFVPAPRSAAQLVLRPKVPITKQKLH
jgi:hypothetical protein